MVHDLTLHYGLLHLLPDLTLIKLDTKTGQENAYLLTESRHHGPEGMWIQATFFFFVIGSAVLFAVGLTYFYLRKKSMEAREILARLEKGDLKARFPLKRIDEIGSLMVDFNRMAAEIEHLVNRVQRTESARKDILQELSHDIRTPLTSLRTSVETLSDHLHEMPKEQVGEFVSVIRRELSYFLHLIEDLFFIASLGEPRYKQTTEKLDIANLIRGEVEAMKMQERAQGARIRWESNCDRLGGKSSAVLGDPLLIQRLFRNALDNARKHAASWIGVQIQPTEGCVRVLIEDDGIGISDQAVAEFGQRRTSRLEMRGRREFGVFRFGLGDHENDFGIARRKLRAWPEKRERRGIPGHPIGPVVAQGFLFRDRSILIRAGRRSRARIRTRPRTCVRTWRGARHRAGHGARARRRAGRSALELRAAALHGSLQSRLGAAVERGLLSRLRCRKCNRLCRQSLPHANAKHKASVIMTSPIAVEFPLPEFAIPVAAFVGVRKARHAELHGRAGEHEP